VSKYQFHASDIYLPGTDIPRNLLGITEPELLHEVEETLLQQAYQTFIADRATPSFPRKRELTLTSSPHRRESTAPSFPRRRESSKAQTA